MDGKGVGGEGRKKVVDTIQRTVGKGDVITERILIKLSCSQSSLLVS